MYKTLYLFILTLPFLVSGQNKYTVSGYVTDAKSGEQIIGATIFNAQSGNGAITNNYGFFSLTLPEGKCNLEFRFLGFQQMVKNIELKADTFLAIQLKKGVDIEEVKVTGYRNIHSNHGTFGTEPTTRYNGNDRNGACNYERK